MQVPYIVVALDEDTASLCKELKYSYHLHDQLVDSTYAALPTCGILRSAADAIAMLIKLFPCSFETRSSPRSGNEGLIHKTCCPGGCSLDLQLS